MKIENLRPHVCSKLAHDLGREFLDQLEIILKNGLIESDLFFDAAFFIQNYPSKPLQKFNPIY